MGIHEPHRKTVRHFDEIGDCRELTFSCYRRTPLLTNNTWREMLSRSIDAAVERHGYRLAAFVFMPEHVHLLVVPSITSGKIQSLLSALKRPYSFRIKTLLVAARSPLLKKLTVMERPGKMAFRFWQEGPGYDRNLNTIEAIEASIEYIHLNPVRRGLVLEASAWRWSSCRHYLSDGTHRDPALPTVHGFPAETWDR